MNDDEAAPATLHAEPAPVDLTQTSEPEPSSSQAAESSLGSLTPRRRDPGRYRFLGEHGRGGIGRVSRAHDIELGRDIAIKELIARGPIDEVRFLREALITARLEHPGIVPVHEAGRWPDGTPFYAMKLVAGRPLRDLIAERKSVEHRVALLHHVIAVADAIAYAHERGIVHRDLKPSNVIVGDFGETVVIDWGLAKDLTSTDVATTEASAAHIRSAQDLTSTGVIMGTPAYMAPEQARGEVVDQRADVFAIGVMLWELCTLEKLPPKFSGQRERTLRKYGTDQDLAVIVTKALEPDRQHRYPDAGALATDLKAFKAGTRIAARQYSIFAMLRHWARRHRSIALTITATAIAGLFSAALYVSNIAAARNRADASQAIARTALDALTLKHAELLLKSDPSETLKILANYEGSDIIQKNRLRAEAIGHGVATLRASPHTDSIYWLQGTEDKSVLSLSIDGTITRTLPDGRSSVLAQGVKHNTTIAYAASRHLLAYICEPKNLCLLHSDTGLPIQVFNGDIYNPIALSFSPDESRIAVISAARDLWILDLKYPNWPSIRSRTHLLIGGGILLLDAETAAVGTPDGLTIVRPNGTTKHLVDRDGTLWATLPFPQQLAVATDKGRLYTIDTTTLNIISQVQACSGAVSGLRAIAKASKLAFACNEGTIGYWDVKNNNVTILVHLEGHAHVLEVSHTGELLIAASDSGILMVIDLVTGLPTTLRGQGLRVTAVSGGNAAYPFILSGDVQGGIRVWPLPDRGARIVANLHSKTYSSIYDNDDQLLIAATKSPTLHSLSTAFTDTSLGPHVDAATQLAISSDGRRFLAYGTTPTVEIWSTRSPALITTIQTQHPNVTHAAFYNEAGDIITSGIDGHFVQWNSAGKDSIDLLFSVAIEHFLVLSDNGTVVVATQDNALWLVPPDHKKQLLRRGESRVTCLRVLSDHVSILVGYLNGELRLIDVSTHEERTLARVRTAVEDILPFADDHTVAFLAHDDSIQFVTLNGSLWSSDSKGLELAHPRHIALTSNDTLLILSSDGTLWAYNRSRHHWVCKPLTGIELVGLTIAETMAQLFLFDIEGHLLSVDLNNIYQQL